MNQRLADYTRSAAFRMELSAAMIDGLRYHACLEATAPEVFNNGKDVERRIEVTADFRAEG